MTHCHFIPSFFSIFISHLYFSLTLTRLRSDCQVWSKLKTEPVSCSSMPACYSLRLDPWQLSLKYSNLAAQLARAWQAICQVAGSKILPESLSFFLSFFLISISHLSFSMTLTRSRSDCQVWNKLRNLACASYWPHLPDNFVNLKTRRQTSTCMNIYLFCSLGHTALVLKNSI